MQQEIEASEALRREHVREANKRRAKIEPAVFPLAVRDGGIGEIALIVGLPSELVKNAINRMRIKPEGKTFRRLPKPIQRSIVEHRMRTMRIINGKLTQDDLYDIEFAKKIVDEGFITTDLSTWNFLGEIYQKSSRALPKDFSKRLRLEAFLAARVALQQGDTEPIRTYRDLGENVDYLWFDRSLQKEEDFIANVPLMSAFGYREDAEGFFTIDKQGKWRPLVPEENVIFDNSWLASQRLASRNRLAKGK